MMIALFSEFCRRRSAFMLRRSEWWAALALGLSGENGNPSRWMSIQELFRLHNTGK